MSNTIFISSYRDLRAAEQHTTPAEVQTMRVETTLGFLLALRGQREFNLRDDFAKGAIATAHMLLNTRSPRPAVHEIAQTAYQLADALVAERDRA